jgi:Tfp pilus assembly protein FimT
MADGAGYTAIEAMTVVAGIGIVTSLAAPSISRLRATHEVYSATWNVAGMLQQVRARAANSSTPHLVYIQKEDVVDGERGVFALIVRDNDRSYSVTPPDEVETYSLGPEAPAAVRQYGVADEVELPYPNMPPVAVDLYPAMAVSTTTTTTVSTSSDSSPAAPTGKSKKLKSQKKAKGKSSDLVGGLIGGVTSLVSDLLAGGSTSSGSATTATVAAPATTGSASTAPDSSSDDYTLEEIVTNGASFEVSEDEGVPAVAFNERGIPVSTESPTEWGTGSGAVYLTDNARVVCAAIVSPLGEISVAQYDAANSVWK